MALARIARNGCQQSGGATGRYARVGSMLGEELSSVSKSHSPFSGRFTAFNQNVTPHSSNLPFFSTTGGLPTAALGSRGLRTTPRYEYAHAQAAVEESDSECENLKYPTLEATKPSEKPRVVVIGSGWAAFRFLKGLNTKVYDIVCISPRNHMVFTPLLASTCVGTLEFRSVAEPVNQIQSLLKSLSLPKAPGGRIGIDDWLRVPSVEDVFAIGDCAGFVEGVGRPVLPALAQVAERQGKYLVELFNRVGKQGGKASSGKDIPLGDPFVYKHLRSMASVGRYKALVDLRQSKDAKGLSLAGFLSWFIWRSAYLTRVISWRNRFYVAVNWATTLVFGRDNSRI
ncbi:internal alternative NAD(P)H-ubiquinone oxidoreductase A2, mitochondrial-like [Salvia splendens]|nr:internal alternative NAD(P)H-ubiquinone oxidoreductase A2, mitochondrial-like [Salvia splendens]